MGIEYSILNNRTKQYIDLNKSAHISTEDIPNLLNFIREASSNLDELRFESDFSDDYLNGCTEFAPEYYKTFEAISSEYVDDGNYEVIIIKRDCRKGK